MEGTGPITGFSRLSKMEKIEMAARLSSDPAAFTRELARFWHHDPEVQHILEEFSENTVSNYCMPFGLAPNFLINDRVYILPMVIEESSVVAAASKSAKFWYNRGGFRAEVVNTTKPGHVYFKWKVSRDLLLDQEEELEQYLIRHTSHLTENMRKRGGGIKSVRILGLEPEMPGYFKLEALFETADSMGANFINTCLEAMARLLPEYFHEQGILIDEHDFDILMAILSNNTPECLVTCKVECPEEEFTGMGGGLTASEFVGKFQEAVRIANHDTDRGVTHNKGIFNGVDALVLATGNDYRAIEAAGHAYASREGKYRSLSTIELSGGIFSYSLRLPMALGTIGGLTRAHPLARLSMDLLGFPGAGNLMEIAASAGLANNFGAIWSLVTSGIQEGHMKMHLSNILNSLGATPDEKDTAGRFFSDREVSYRAVEEYLIQLRRSR
jgi:hydroxymethylglutaryl-CoA reductase